MQFKDKMNVIYGNAMDKINKKHSNKLKNNANSKIKLNDELENSIAEYNIAFEEMKDVILYANICIEDGSNLKGRATIYVNGDIVYDNNRTSFGMESIEIPFDRINEVKIKVSGNAKLWDVGVSKLKHWWQ